MKSKEKEFHSSLRLNFVIFSSIWLGKRWAKRCVDCWSKSPSINHDKNHNSKVSVVQFSNATRHQPHFLLTSTQFFNFKIINLQIKQSATRINYYKCHENWKILRILREISKNTRSGFMIYRFFYFLLFLLWIYNWKCHSLIVIEKKCWNVILSLFWWNWLKLCCKFYLFHGILDCDCDSKTFLDVFSGILKQNGRFFRARASTYWNDFLRLF